MKNFKEFMEEMDSEDSRTSVAKRKFSTPKAPTSASHSTGSVISKGGARLFNFKKKKKVEVKTQEED